MSTEVLKFHMDDDSRNSNSNSIVQSLKNEWSLFWDSLAGEDETAESAAVAAEAEASSESEESSFGDQPLSVLSLDDVRRLTQKLSQGRKTLNQRLESLNKEIELNAAKLESLRLVGSSDEDVLSKINELNDQGQRLAQELAELDLILRQARAEEDRLRQELTPA